MAPRSTRQKIKDKFVANEGSCDLMEDRLRELQNLYMDSGHPEKVANLLLLTNAVQELKTAFQRYRYTEA